jgi:hypothetical protein
MQYSARDFEIEETVKVVSTGEYGKVKGIVSHRYLQVEIRKENKRPELLVLIPAHGQVAKATDEEKLMYAIYGNANIR